MKIAMFSNSKDPDNMANKEPAHPDLYCLPSVFMISSYDIVWTKPFFFFNFADANFVVSCFGFLRVKTDILC